jgi:hypothetical protein
MSAQKHATKKNFIAIVSEAAEERHVDRPAKTDQPARRSLLGLMVAVLNRDIDARRLSN